MYLFHGVFDNTLRADLELGKAYITANTAFGPDEIRLFLRRLRLKKKAFLDRDLLLLNN
jgi:hypothetical protein